MMGDFEYSDNEDLLFPQIIKNNINNVKDGNDDGNLKSISNLQQQKNSEVYQFLEKIGCSQETVRLLAGEAFSLIQFREKFLPGSLKKVIADEDEIKRIENALLKADCEYWDDSSLLFVKKEPIEKTHVNLLMLCDAVSNCALHIRHIRCSILTLSDAVQRTFDSGDSAALGFQDVRNINCLSKMLDSLDIASLKIADSTVHLRAALNQGLVQNEYAVRCKLPVYSLCPFIITAVGSAFVTVLFMKMYFR